MARRISGNLVEQDGGVTHLAHIDVDDAADLLLRLGALDVFQFAGSFDACDPVTQILVGHDSALPDQFASRPAAFTRAASIAISRLN